MFLRLRLYMFFAVLLFTIPFSCADVQDDEGTEVKIEKTFAERVAEVEAQIRNTPEWLRAVEQKAADKNIPPDSMIRMDAEWLVREQSGGAKASLPANEAELAAKIQEMEMKIRNDKAWLKSIEQKARERNISVDSMIRIDARFVVEEQMKQGKQ